MSENEKGIVNAALEIAEADLYKNRVDNNKNAENFRKLDQVDDQESFYQNMYHKSDGNSGFYDHFTLTKKSVIRFILQTFPILSWLSSYKKDDFANDLISGCTVAIMHIPQGMGYALLANLPPVVGIYIAIFPVIFYAIFCTSKHNSMGSFAVVGIMMGKIVSKYSNQHVLDDGIGGYSAIEIATTVCFIVGSIHMTMYFFRLGVLSNLLSECLVSGFTTGCANHVLTSQIKNISGIKLSKIEGNFKLLQTYVEILKRIAEVNVTTLIIAVVAITVLVINNEILKPRVAKKTKIPIPIELIVVVSGTVLSKLFDLGGDEFKVVLVGHIPSGFPLFQLPKFELFRELFLDAFAIAFVSYSVTVSMGLIIGRKMKYEIDFNQELLAMGSGNLFGSFISCYPFSASMSRSLIQQTVGGRTQLASLISCVLLTFVLLWIGPFFEVLPRCILAAIVIVALKGMLWQITDFYHFMRKSTIDGCIWMITFSTVVLFSIDIGLLVGIVLSLLYLIYNGLSGFIYVLGNVPNTDLFLDIENFQKAVEIPNVKIIQYSGTINFATKASFRNQLCGKLGINLLKELKYKEANSGSNNEIGKNNSNIHFKHLILDFGPLTNIDASSINMLTDLIKDFNKLELKVSITSCSTRIYEILIRNEFAYMDILNPSIQDFLK